eukprot:528143_1
METYPPSLQLISIVSSKNSEAGTTIAKIEQLNEGESDKIMEIIVGCYKHEERLQYEQVNKINEILYDEGQLYDTEVKDQLKGINIYHCKEQNFFFQKCCKPEIAAKFTKYLTQKSIMRTILVFALIYVIVITLAIVFEHNPVIYGITLVCNILQTITVVIFMVLVTM